MIKSLHFIGLFSILCFGVPAFEVSAAGFNSRSSLSGRTGKPSAYNDGLDFFTRSAAASAQPSQADIDAAASGAISRGRIIKVTSGGLDIPGAMKELTSLPVIFRTVINGYAYDITVMSMNFTPTGATLSVGCRFTVPNTQTNLYFGANDISFSGKSGFKGDLPILESSLSSADAERLDDASGLLAGQTQFSEFILPGFKDHLSMGLGKKSKMSVSCGAFNSFNLSGYVTASGLVEKETQDGQVVNDKPLLLVFENQLASDWKDIFLDAKVSSGFHAGNYDDLGFHFDGSNLARIDLSTLRNPDNLPSCAQVQTESWQGIAFPSYKVRLPGFFKLRTGSLLAMASVAPATGKNLFMDAGGLIGDVAAENVFNLQQGYTDEVNKYDMSLDKLSAAYSCNGQVTVSMLGKIGVPWCGTATKSAAPLLDYSFRYANNRYEVFIKDNKATGFSSNKYALPGGSDIIFNVQDGALSVKATQPDKPLLSSDAYANSICKDFSATLSASQCAGKQLIWSTGETVSTLTVKPAVTTTYWVKCQDNYCVSAMSDSIKITVIENLPKVSLLSGKDAFCSSESTDLRADNCAGKVQWQLPGTDSFRGYGTDQRVQNANFPGISQTTSYTYSARCELNGCVGPVASKTVTVYPQPALPVLSSNAPGNTIDRNNSVTLSGQCPSGQQLIWKDLSQTTLTLASTATYHAVCRSEGMGCESGAQPITISVIYAPPSAASGLNFTNVGSNFLTLNWQDNSGNEDAFQILRSTSPDFSNAQPVGEVAANTTSYQDNGLTEGVNYYYQVMSRNRYDSAYSQWNSTRTTTIQKAPRPNLRAEKNPIKPGDNTVVYADGCDGTVTWSTGATGNSIWTGAGDYWAICKKNGFRDSDGGTITVYQDNTPTELPQASRPNLRADKNPVKSGENTVVYADGCDGTVTWSNGATGNSIWTGAGEYWAICKKNGFRDSDGGTITVYQDNTPTELPQASRPNLRADKNPVKPGENTVVYADGCDGTVIWSTGTTGNSIWTSAGDYWAICKKDGYRDSERGTIRIDQDNTPTELPQAPRPNLRADKNPVKPGENTVVYADACDGTVTWSNGATGNSIWTGAGEYWAICKKDGFRDSEGGTIRVDQDNTPIELPQASRPNLRADKNPVKPGENTVVYADGCDGTVTWSNGATGNSIWTGAGEYWAICKKDGYRDSEGGTIRVDQDNTPIELPQASRPNLRADKNPVKPGENTVVYADGCDGTVTWSNGATGNSIWTGVGDYWAVCKKDGYRDSDAGTIRIDQDNTPVELPQASRPNLRADKNPVEPGENTVVYADGCDGTVTWSNGATGNSIWTGAGDYWAVCKKDGYRDSEGGTIRVDQDNTPIELPQASRPNLRADKNPVKPGENTVVYADGCDGTVIWSNGAAGNSIWTGAGDYWAICKKDGYRDSDAGTIRIDQDNTPTERTQAPQPGLRADRGSVKDNEQTRIYADGCDGGTILWSTGESGNQIDKSHGDYSAICHKDGYRDSNPSYITIGRDQSVAAVPTPNVSPTYVNSCGGSPVNISVTGCPGNNFIWEESFGGESEVINGKNFTPYSSGTFLIYCLDNNRVGSPVSVLIQSKPSPSAPSVSGPVFVDKNTNFTLTASGCTDASVFNWSPSGNVNPAARIPAGSSQITTAISSSTTFSVTCSENGCSSSPAYFTVRANENVPIPDPVNRDPDWQATTTVCSGNGRIWQDINRNSSTSGQTKCVGATNICKTYLITPGEAGNRWRVAYTKCDGTTANPGDDYDETQRNPFVIQALGEVTCINCTKEER